MRNQAFLNTRASGITHFIDETERFFSAIPLRAKRATIDCDEEDQISTSTRNHLTRMDMLPQRRLRVAMLEVGEEGEPALLYAEQARGFLGQSLCGDVLACRVAQLDLGITIWRLVSRYHASAWQNLTDESVASLLVALLSLSIGLPVQSAMDLRIGLSSAKIDISPGCLDLETTSLHLYPGSGYDDSLYGRIPTDTVISLQLVGSISSLCRILSARRKEPVWLRDFLGQSAMDTFTLALIPLLADYKTPFGRVLPPQLRRLGSGWCFMGRVLAHCPPARLAMFCGHALGPWRADSSYIGISPGGLDQTLGAVIGVLNSLAGMDPTHDLPFVLNTHVVGPLVPCLKYQDQLSTTVPTSSSPVCGHLELGAALAAMRPGGNCFLVSDPSYGGEPLLAVADKNLGGGCRWRLVPMGIPPSIDIDRNVIYTRVDTSLGNRPSNTPRRMLLSALDATGHGQLVQSVYSEHADNALLAGGPLCPVPSSLILERARQAILKAIEEPEITRLLDRSRTRPSDALVTPANEPLHGKRLRHTSGVEIPTNDDFSVVEKATRWITERIDTLGRERLAPSIIILLAVVGRIPWTNLTRYRAYYGLRDFAVVGGKLFFVALLSQKNSGMGAIPLPLAEGAELTKLLLRVGRDKRIRTRKLIDDGLRNLESLLVSMDIDPAKFRTAVRRVSYYNCHNCFSGLVAAALASRLTIPLNYVAEADIFAALCEETPMSMFDENTPWYSPHSLTTAWNSSHGHKAISALDAIGNGNYHYRLGVSGPSIRLHDRLRCDSADWSSYQWAEFAVLFGPMPSAKVVRSWIEKSSPMKCSASAQREAVAVRAILRKRGQIKLDPPLRFIPPSKARVLMTRLTTVIRKQYPGKRGERLCAGVITAGLVGPRPKELFRLRGALVHLVGQLVTLDIAGVGKTHRSRRVATANILSPNGSTRDLWREELTMLLDTMQFKADTRICDYNSAIQRHFQDSVTSCLHLVGKDVFGNGDGLTYYSLRHLCAWLLLDELLKAAFEVNYFDVLASCASNMGHSLPEFLGGYIGTAVIVLQASAGMVHSFGLSATTSR